MTHNLHCDMGTSHLRNTSLGSNSDFPGPSKEDMRENLCSKDKSEIVHGAPLCVPMDDGNLDGSGWEEKIDVEADSDPEVPNVKAKSAGNLWGHKDLATKSSRTRIILLIVLVLVGYSTALFVNSVASRFVPPRFNLHTHEEGRDPLARLGIVVHVFDPTFLISLFRGVAAGCLLVFMTLRKDTPWDAATNAKKVDEYKSEKLVVDNILLNPFVLNTKLLLATLMGMCSAGGYMFFMMLTARSGSATWSAMVGLYVVIPCIYGIAVKGEARTPKKIVGILLCAVASVLLSLGKQRQVDEEDGTGVSWLQTTFLFFMAVLCWGVCDGMAAYIGRGLHTFYVVIFTGVGFMSISFLASIVSYIAVAMHPVEDELVPPDTPDPIEPDNSLMSPGVGYFLLFLAQLGGVAGWYGSVLLGKLSEASAFLPITSLYTILSALLAVAILGETLTAFGWSGIALAMVGMLAIATS